MCPIHWEPFCPLRKWLRPHKRCSPTATWTYLDMALLVHVPPSRHPHLGSWPSFAYPEPITAALWYARGNGCKIATSRVYSDVMCGMIREPLTVKHLERSAATYLQGVLTSDTLSEGRNVPCTDLSGHKPSSTAVSYSIVICDSIR